MMSVRALKDTFTLDRVLHSITAKGAYGNVTEELFVLTLLLCSLVPVWSTSAYNIRIPQRGGYVIAGLSKGISALLGCFLVTPQDQATRPHIDIFMVDVIWVGLFKDHLLPLTDHGYNLTDLEDFYDGIVDNNRAYGKPVALPCWMDVGLLFYRKDLLRRSWAVEA